MKRENKISKFTEKYFPYILEAPALIIIFILALFPLFYALKMALHETILTNPGSHPFAGLNNFREALNKDPMVWYSLKNTAIFTVSAVSLEMVLGCAIAFLLNRKIKFQGLIRGLLLLPMACAPIAVGLVWRYMYHPDFGVFNFFCNALGLAERNWLGDVSTAMLSLVVFDVWQWTPFIIFVVLAGLQALPREPFEAAEVDGASRWQIFKTLTFPMLAPLLIFVLILRTIDALRFYDPIYALTRGGPGTTTETITWYLYKIGFKFFNMGYASSIAFIFLYAVIILSAVLVAVLKSFSLEEGG